MAMTLLGDGRLGPLLARTLGDDAWRDFEARLISGGKSNLTFELTAGEQRVILRRPPTGDLLPTAHDMGRETRVLRALESTAVPVPRVLYADHERETLGVPFYVMAPVPGIVVRDELPDGYADTPAERRAIGIAIVDALAAIHRIDPKRVGLADFGRPVGFMKRQVRRWSSQWEASADREVPAVCELGRRLGSSVPAAARESLVHGDYRLDNCVLDAGQPGKVNAVLDWEMSTLGDPLADLGMLLLYWPQPAEPRPVLTSAVTMSGGFPTRAELVDRYLQATGFGSSDLRFYEAFAHFKFAVIAEGIAARVRGGAMAGQNFGDLASEVERIAERGLSILDGGAS